MNGGFGLLSRTGSKSFRSASRNGIVTGCPECESQVHTEKNSF